MARLQGGAASFTNATSREYTSRIGFFRQDVNTVFISGKVVVRGKILPAFNPEINENDSTFRGSWAPYRSAAIIDPNTNFPAFTSWFLCLRGYDFWGPQNTSFISPSINQALGANDPQWIDPISTMRRFVRGKIKDNDPRYMKYASLVERPQNGSWKDNPLALPPSAMLTFLNVYSTGSTEEESEDFKNRVMVLKSSSFEFLMAALDKECTVNKPQHCDTNWPGFRYGDVTDPSAGIAFASQSNLSPLDAKLNYKFTGLAFGRTCYPHLDADGCQAWPVTQEILNNRYDLQDTENGPLHIPTSADIMQVIAEDAIIPYDLVAEVLGGYMEVPHYSATPKTTYTPPAQSAPPAQAPMGMPPGSPYATPVAQAPEEKYWVVSPQNPHPEEVTNTQLQQLVDAGFPGSVCPVSNPAKGWVKAAELGIFPTQSNPAPVSSPSPAPSPYLAGTATSGAALPPAGGGSVTAPIQQTMGMPTAQAPMGMPAANAMPMGMPTAQAPMGMPAANAMPMGMPTPTNGSAPSVALPPEFEGVQKVADPVMPPAQAPMGMPVGAPAGGLPATPPAVPVETVMTEPLTGQDLTDFVNLNKKMKEGGAEVSVEDANRWMDLSRRATQEQLMNDTGVVQ